MTVRRLLFIFCCGFLVWESSSVIDQIKDIARSAEEILLDLGRGVKYVSKGLHLVGGILNDAIEEHCVYSCPDGSKPIQNRYHRPSFDGCGSFGFKVPSEELPLAELTNCCNEHDICYDTCNEIKEECDNLFKKCLYKICEKSKAKLDTTLLQGCKAAAKLMYTSTVALGCNAYTTAQSKACYCPNKKDKGKASHKEL